MTPQPTPARTAEDIETIRILFREYAAGLGFDLGFQGFEAELALLPGKYAPPKGELLLAHAPDGEAANGAAVGCVAIRPLGQPGVAEVKRLYVRPAGRGSGAGRALATAAVSFATAAGYTQLVLDTNPSMQAAITMYRTLGFEPIKPYWDNPLPGFLYFGKCLA
ncbi:GNAT family N-acetyltransferase [Acidisphaera sp. L21]|uniref:GNAT family N-acetyltransferase n=1 Tax=Acidisphaera sp. L21 TaxID=1641851 RepID=UPI00131BABFB|nr:GNAT family N-acetyltransferase [Acidisphaera sp. L21]